MNRTRLTAFFVAGVCLTLTACTTSDAAPPATSKEPSSAALPAWWQAHVTFMTEKGGTWLTPNPPGENDPQVPDAFGMEWSSANDGYGLIGRLYGVEAGRETIEFWSFREFFHPGERRVILEQWGGPGVYGVGETTAPAPGRGQTDQTFWLPDGRKWREGHRTVENDDEYLTEVFDIGDDGQWTLRNGNTWRRVPLK